jgi:hypothetical protein
MMTRKCLCTCKCLCTLGIALSLGAATAQQRWPEPGAAALATDGSVTGFAQSGPAAARPDDSPDEGSEPYGRVLDGTHRSELDLHQEIRQLRRRVQKLTALSTSPHVRAPRRIGSPAEVRVIEAFLRHDHGLPRLASGPAASRACRPSPTIMRIAPHR